MKGSQKSDQEVRSRGKRREESATPQPSMLPKSTSTDRSNERYVVVFSFISWPRWVTAEVFWNIVLNVVTNALVLYHSYQLCDQYVNGERASFPGLQPGWLFGRLQDLSDSQWSSWRSNLPQLVMFACVHLGIRAAFKNWMPNAKSLHMIVSAAIGIGFVAHIYGSSFIFFLGVVLINFALSRSLGSSQLAAMSTWVFNIFVLFSSKYFGGYKFSAIFGPSFQFLDDLTGPLSWQTSFNISLTRLISFSMDYYWMLCRREGSKDPPSFKPNTSELAKRMDTDLPESQYDFLHYITYIFYAPVFIGGPILSFNAFASQLHKPMKSFKPMEIVWMIVRLVLWNLALEVAIHFVYFDGINDQELWINDPTYPSWAIAFGGFFTLHFMWTKFMTIWRFFRIWAIIDGIECPENMLRWIHNNFTFTGFWKGWHASLNKWIVRYLFVPLGGSKTQAWNMWVIFTFIGLWHDLWWRWVAWAWITCICFCGELAVIKFFGSKRRFGWLHGTWYWSVLKVVAAGFNIILLCVSNLAIPHGFIGIYHFLKRSYFHRYGVVVFIGCMFYTGIAHLVQIRQREEEERRRLEKQN